MAEDRAFALDAHELLTFGRKKGRMTVCEGNVSDKSLEKDDERRDQTRSRSDTLEPPDVYEWYERNWD